jgi:hypothetical protein
MLYLSGKVKKLDLISVVLILASILISFMLIRSYYDGEIRILKSEVVLYKESLDRLKTKISVPRYPFATNYERKDYHDYDFMDKEAMRVGPGEQGQKHILTEPADIIRNEQLHQRFGFYCVASDHISVNRSLPDVRLPR